MAIPLRQIIDELLAGDAATSDLRADPTAWLGSLGWPDLEAVELYEAIAVRADELPLDEAIRLAPVLGVEAPPGPAADAVSGLLDMVAAEPMTDLESFDAETDPAILDEQFDAETPPDLADPGALDGLDELDGAQGDHAAHVVDDEGPAHLDEPAESWSPNYSSSDDPEPDPLSDDIGTGIESPELHLEPIQHEPLHDPSSDLTDPEVELDATPDPELD